jgi:hypothetical protein
LYKGTGRDPDADTEDRLFESLIFIIIQVAGKRMVVDRQRIINKVRVQEVQSGRQACGQGRQYSQAGGFRGKGRQGSKLGGLLAKER